MPEPPKKEPFSSENSGYSLTLSELLGDGSADLKGIILGFLRGLPVALAGGWIWALTSSSAEMQFGFMAIFVGLLTGLAVRFFGDPESLAHGLVAVLCGLLGIVFGNLLVVLGFLSKESRLSYRELWTEMGTSGLFDTLRLFTSPIDLAFYAVGCVAAFQAARTKTWLRK